MSAALATSLAVPTAAHADYGYPLLERPAGEHVVAATSSSFTVASTRAPHALSYQMWVSTSEAGLYVANLTSSTRRVYSTSPTLTVTGLGYRSAPYYYRLKTVHGSSFRWGGIYPAGVTPAAPTGVHVVSGDIGTYLTWNPQSAATFAVTWATDPAMTQNRVTRMLYGQHYQYTPYGLTKGVHYYFRVRASNYGSNSGYSAQVATTALTNSQTLRAVSYNILMASTVGYHPYGAEVYASWAARRSGVVKLLTQAQADVIGVQEAADWAGSVHGYGGIRQVDDIVRYMPGYTVARTETPPTEHYYHRIGNYIIYKSSAWEPYGAGGHWYLGDGHWAAYQVLRSRTTGAKFLYTSSHLGAGHGASWDAQRYRNTQSLLSQSAALAGKYHVRVVYGGDFNSARTTDYPTDAPDLVMRAAHMTDSRLASLYRYNQWYNSANNYFRTPPQSGHSIDHIFAGPGIAVRSWGVLANLVNRSFVGVIPSDHDPVWSTITIPAP